MLVTVRSDSYSLPEGGNYFSWDSHQYEGQRVGVSVVTTHTVGCKYVEIFATPGVANSSVMLQPTVSDIDAGGQLLRDETVELE